MWENGGKWMEVFQKLSEAIPDNPDLRKNGAAPQLAAGLVGECGRSELGRQLAGTKEQGVEARESMKQAMKQGYFFFSFCPRQHPPLTVSRPQVRSGGLEHCL